MTMNMIPIILNLKISISLLHLPLISLLMPGANNGLFTLSFIVRIERTYSLINIQLAFFPPSISWIGVLFHFDLGWV